MSRILTRYRSYLVAKARSAKPNYLSEVQWLSAPWVIPVALAALICWGFDLVGIATLYVTIPLGAITLAGMVYVFWIFMKYSIVADYKAAKGSSAE